MPSRHQDGASSGNLRGEIKTDDISTRQNARHLAQTTPWGITATQVDQVSFDESSDIMVCVVDSGYEMGHEDLPSSGVTGSPDPGTGNWYKDGSHHGTHVAGTIAALGNGDGVVGVIPGGNLSLHIVKVFGDTGGWSYSSNLIAAVEKCEAKGVELGARTVVNMSLGGSFKSRTEDRAFANLDKRGVLSIAAAGNDGNTRKSYPASYASVVSVAAVDSALNIADFSQQNDQVQLAAPGAAVRSTVPMGRGFEESLEVAESTFEVTAMDFSPPSSGSGELFLCQGVGLPGECAGLFCPRPGAGAQ